LRCGLDFELVQARRGHRPTPSANSRSTRPPLVAQLEATVKADQAMIDMAQTAAETITRIRSLATSMDATGSRVIDAGNFVADRREYGSRIAHQSIS